MNSIPNAQIELAFNYITYTNKHIFLTGKAGTGKTTFLQRIRNETIKRLAVVAPSGVAAINARGVTIHSLFQLPFGPLVPGQSQNKKNHRRFTGKKISLLKSLDLLVIDEISMVRADVMDAIDNVLRQYRDYNLPFGGIQLLMIGDLHQLPPVVKPNEWELLKEHYKTPYFFESLALQNTEVISIELLHIYRQSDRTFIELLDRVRNNTIDEDILKTLNSRYQDNFNPSDDEGYITLTSHNAAAQRINAEKLSHTPGKIRHFQATIEGDFPPHIYPAEEKFEIKVGAQVMFIKNDLSPEKQYYNGKIGKVSKIAKEAIFVLCPGENDTIEVKPVEWKNTRYSLDDQTKEVMEEEIGTFTQHPLKLAWAITIHKSQGLTFEKVIIDAESSFAHGQVYVALSRCKSFEGIVLRSKIGMNSIRTDAVVQGYSQNSKLNQPGMQHLQEAKREYQGSQLRDLFSFNTLKHRFEQLRRAIIEGENSLQGGIKSEMSEWNKIAINTITSIAEKFIPQLDQYFSQVEMPEENEDLKVRLRKASPYFTSKINEVLNGVKELQILSDNKAVKKNVNGRIDNLKKELAIKAACFTSCQDGFSSQTYTKAKVDADIDHKKTPTPATPKRTRVPKDIEHTKLYEKLAAWREILADEQGVELYLIVPTSTLIEIAEVLPTKEESFKKIRGIGKQRVINFGTDIISIVQEYCNENQVEPDQMHLATGKVRKPVDPNKPDTKAISLDLFKKNRSIDKIASERGLARSTIEGHLSHYIGIGELDINLVMKKSKINVGMEYFKKENTGTLTEAKNSLGEGYSYGELKMILAHLRSLENNEEDQVR